MSRLECNFFKEMKEVRKKIEEDQAQRIALIKAAEEKLRKHNKILNYCKAAITLLNELLILGVAFLAPDCIPRIQVNQFFMFENYFDLDKNIINIMRDIKGTLEKPDSFEKKKGHIQAAILALEENRNTAHSKTILMEKSLLALTGNEELRESLRLMLVEEFKRKNNYRVPLGKTSRLFKTRSETSDLVYKILKFLPKPKTPTLPLEGEDRSTRVFLEELILDNYLLLH